MNAPALLSQTIDAYIGWLAAWHREVFPGHARTETPAPSVFQEWRTAALKALPQDDGAIQKISALQEQLHKLARLVFMTAPEEQITRRDYDSVIMKYEELMQGLRRMERAFASAASGLDPLTGLRSRMGLMEDLAREQNRFLRAGRSFCIALMDIDHFKSINDTHGHDAGDRVLAAVADRVSRDLRSFDDAWRWGGEEFLLCLKEADEETGFRVLERLRAALEAKPVILANGKSIPVTASFGYAVSAVDTGPEDLIRAADKALYRAKSEGRNRIIRAEKIKD